MAFLMLTLPWPCGFQSRNLCVLLGSENQPGSLIVVCGVMTPLSNAFNNYLTTPVRTNFPASFLNEDNDILLTMPFLVVKNK